MVVVLVWRLERHRLQPVGLVGVSTTMLASAPPLVLVSWYAGTRRAEEVRSDSEILLAG